MGEDAYEMADRIDDEIVAEIEDEYIARDEAIRALNKAVDKVVDHAQGLRLSTEEVTGLLTFAELLVGRGDRMNTSLKGEDRP